MKKVYDHIAVDFDGTLCCETQNVWPIPGKQKLIHKLILAYVKMHQRRGTYVILNTLRKDDTLDIAKKWCDIHKFEPNRFNDNSPELIARWGNSRKISAQLYIDDRNIGLFGFILRLVSKWS